MAMKLSSLATVTDLAEQRSALLEALEKCRDNSVPAHGDWWFVEYKYQDGARCPFGGTPNEAQNRLRIPASVVREFVEAKIARIEEMLAELGVVP